MIQKIADGRTDLIFDYLAQGHPATSKDPQGTSLIEWCAHYGDVSAVRYLLAQGESLDSLGVNRGLHGAAFHGHWRLVQFLVEMGADVNHPYPGTGETPLHAALCKANRPVTDRIVRILLAAGADPRRKTAPSAPTEAFMRDCRTKGETPLHRAAAFAGEECIEQLLDLGASREDKDMNGETPLSWASWHLRPAAVLRKLCFGPFCIHPDNRSTYDHGTGWAQGEL
jgi:ankyrin repeat protein